MMKCNACGRAGGFNDFFGNHWLKDPDDAYKRCKKCVKEGKFNASGSWKGTPKDPPQILWERGWIDPAVKEKGKEAFNLAYPPEDVGKLVVDLRDRDILLQNFYIAGHYGYGGLDEGLCCFPGCIKEVGLRRCTGCGRAKYCGKKHQTEHWQLHKADCKRTKKMGVYNLQEDPITCVKCGKTNQVFYGYVPEDNDLGDHWVHPGKGGRLMCCECVSAIGGMQEQVTDWVRSHPKNVG
mmetsp:Transcript_56/g.119  ORF Transcript_56/g.119 Transcript_56/m.119 type:complete len:237 (+) Transcript_56:2-712(+)